MKKLNRKEKRKLTKQERKDMRREKLKDRPVNKRKPNQDYEDFMAKEYGQWGV